MSPISLTTPRAVLSTLSRSDEESEFEHTLAPKQVTGVEVEELDPAANDIMSGD